MILIKKAIRSMLRNKKAYISCILLMALGTALYISFNSAILNLTQSKENFYENNRLADIFAKVTTISQSDLDKIENIEGIEEVVPRIVNEFRIEHEDIETIMTVRLISSDLEYEGTTINQYIYEGRDIENDQDILLNSGFMELNNIKIGDEVTIDYSGKSTNFTIVGSVLTPEYVYLVKDPTELMPDQKTFGIGYVSLPMMNKISNSQNTYNDLVMTLKSGFEFDDVKLELEDNLKDYGLTTLYFVDDLLSNVMLETELTSLSGMATSVPVVFLGMVIAILYLTLKRVIEQERMEIGMLKAFGYSNFQILNHYLVYGFATGIFGGILGCIFGYAMCDAMLQVYLEFFMMPMDANDIALQPFIIGFVLSIGCGIVGTLFGVKKVLALSPVDSMKSEVPIVNLKKSHSNNKILKMIFKTSGFMALRNIQRNKLRGLFIIIGIGFSFAMAAFMASATSMIDGMIFVQLNNVKKYDAKFTFFNPIDENTLEYISDYEDVKIANGIYETPVTLRFGTKSTGSNLVGMNPDASLYKIYDEYEKANKKLTEYGIILCSYFADELGVKAGDYIYVDSYLLEDSIKIKVDDVAQMTMADAAYIDIDLLYDLFNVNGYTSIILGTDNYDVIKEDFKNAENIKSIEDKETTNQNLETLMSSYDIMFDFMFFMTVAIVFIIIYNISTIAFSERCREYATLKVMGVTTKEISEIVDLEFWLLTFVGLLLGIFLTYVLKQSMNQMMDVENFALDTKVYPYEIFSASLQCCFAVFLSNLMNKKNIKKLDLVTVLKERG